MVPWSFSRLFVSQCVDLSIGLRQQVLVNMSFPINLFPFFFTSKHTYVYDMYNQCFLRRNLCGV